jgi:hypothetical protein
VVNKCAKGFKGYRNLDVDLKLDASRVFSASFIRATAQDFSTKNLFFDRRKL